MTNHDKPLLHAAAAHQSPPTPGTSQAATTANYLITVWLSKDPSGSLSALKLWKRCNIFKMVNNFAAPCRKFFLTSNWKKGHWKVQVNIIWWVILSSAAASRRTVDCRYLKNWTRLLREFSPVVDVVARDVLCLANLSHVFPCLSDLGSRLSVRRYACRLVWTRCLPHAYGPKTYHADSVCLQLALHEHWRLSWTSFWYEEFGNLFCRWWF